jgi:hypothetical protein
MLILEVSRIKKGFICSALDIEDADLDS